MKTLFLFFIATWLISGNLAHAEKYPEPPNTCYEGCTEWQKQLLSDFETKGKPLSLEPAVYSGECRHLSRDFDPEYTHYSVVLIDQRGQTKEPRFASFFSFFAENNEYRTWSLEKAREEMTEPWKPFGRLIIGERTARVEVADSNGVVTNIYWMRQDPETKALYYISFSGGVYMKSFCRLEKN